MFAGKLANTAGKFWIMYSAPADARRDRLRVADLVGDELVQERRRVRQHAVAEHLQIRGRMGEQRLVGACDGSEPGAGAGRRSLPESGQRSG